MERVTIITIDRHSDDVWVMAAEHPETGRSFWDDWEAARGLDRVPDGYDVVDMRDAVSEEFGWKLTQLLPTQQVFL
jgi:hypothetical protein